MDSTDDQVLYSRLLTRIGDGGVAERTPQGIVITTFEGRALMQRMHLRITPSSLGDLVRSTAGASAGAFPEVEPVEAAWHLFLVHLDEAIQTAAPGETELVPSASGVDSLRPDLTRTPDTPEQQDHWEDQQRYDRLVQHFADRGRVELELEAQTVVIRDLDGRPLPNPVRIRVPFPALADRLRRAEDPDGAVVELVRELEAEISAGHADIELRADGSLHVRA